MTIYTLSHGSLKLDVSDQGGVIEGFWRDTTPLLRPGKKSGVATDASCFPLVPFANRVSGNRFVWQGREIRPIRKWIQSGKTFDAKLLIDENIALKSL